ncbi:MAG: hypothetical protein PHF79_04105 [Candidatus Pacebacteria bacterium]|nr:hypothetical protein [Candidatus Paceibacterota bacterium]
MSTELVTKKEFNGFKEEMYSFRKEMNARFDLLEKMLANKFNTIDIRFNILENTMVSKFAEVDKQFQLVDKKFERVDKKFEEMRDFVHTEIEGLAIITNRSFSDHGNRIQSLERVGL